MMHMDKMPVRSTDFDLFSAMEPMSSAEPFFSDDIWKKFDFDLFDNFSDALNELMVADLTDSLFSEIEASDMCEIRNHDCMWAGHCASKEHPVDEPRELVVKQPVATAPGAASYRTPASHPALHKKLTMKPTTSQQSLLKPSLRSANLPIISMTLQTPPMSDDEEVKAKKQHPNVLQILNDAICEYDPDDEENQDLCKYFEEDDQQDLVEVTEEEDEDEDDDEGEEEEQQPAPAVSQTTRMFNKYAAESDHSYHKDKNASMRMANLGIDTPSDSEEEIDVVSVGEKFNNNRIGYALPTNPSRSDRRQLQRTMASAISNNRQQNGIKTILPTRRAPASPDFTPTKRRTQQTQKKSRQYRLNNSSPYKRRSNYGNSSDSEPEPSEKRSLHNNMERQRRIDLRNAFEYLRKLVPEVLAKERAAKVVILREAARYCTSLTNTSYSLNRQVDGLKKHQERLRHRVSMLRRNLASKR